MGGPPPPVIGFMYGFRIMGFLISVFLWLLIPLALIGLPATALVLGVQKTPLVTENQNLTPTDAEKAIALWERYDPRHMKPGEVTRVVAHEIDLNSAVSVGLSNVGTLSGRVNVNPARINVDATVELPPRISALGRYVNVRAAFAPSESGLHVARLRIGRIELPPQLALPAVQIAFDTVIGPGRGEEILNSVRSVAVSEKSVSVAYLPPSQQVTEEIKTAIQAVANIADASRVRVYYDGLVKLADNHPNLTPVSMAAYIRPIFRYAASRSVKGDPVEENRAAILALAIYFRDPRFELLIGNVLTQKLRERPPRTLHVRLQGRHDFVQHFIISAGLALAGGLDMVEVAGLFKELRDATKSSGFSFTDLAANRAGGRFARGAVASREAATQFQTKLSAEIGEEDIFPRILDLPEGLTKAEFEYKFGDTNSQDYKELTAEIDRRIENIPLYQ